MIVKPSSLKLPLRSQGRRSRGGNWAGVVGDAIAVGVDPGPLLDHGGVKVRVSTGMLVEVVAPHESLLADGAQEFLFP